ncbi:MAG: hypothetical protein ABJE99_00555 [Roseobacter sp.]
MVTLQTVISSHPLRTISLNCAYTSKRLDHYSWLDKRLEDGSDTTSLAQHSLYAASTFCRLLGTELLRLPENAGFEDHDQIRAAQSVGFDVAIGGQTTVNEPLGKLAAYAAAYSDLPNKAFGDLYRAFARPYLHEECFDGFRRIVWEQILAIWPVAAGEVILGYSLPERRLHSLQSAAKETGLGTFLLDQFLIEAGAYSSEDSRPAPRKTFDAIKYSPLLAEVPALVGPLKMSKVIGATLRQFRRLAEDGVFVPRKNSSNIKSPWRLEDGISFINELNDKTIEISMGDCEWELIQKAKLRTRMSVGEIIGFIREDKRRIALREGMRGSKNFYVNKHEVDRLATDNGPVAV